MNTSDPTSTHRFSVTQRVSVLRPDSIRNKILVFAVLATLLPSLATAWFSYLENKRSLTAKASEQLLGVSSQTAREVDLWTKERRYELRVFAVKGLPDRWFGESSVPGTVFLRAGETGG